MRWAYVLYAIPTAPVHVDNLKIKHFPLSFISNGKFYALIYRIIDVCADALWASEAQKMHVPAEVKPEN
ncbi:hypothetical protein NBRC116602_19330 [Hyphomicrobiales bacterium 4NK60-0047b]